jgi:hypothetical protein
MTATQLPTEEEARAAYAQGENAVVQRDETGPKSWAETGRFTSVAT